MLGCGIEEDCEGKLFGGGWSKREDPKIQKRQRIERGNFLTLGLSRPPLRLLNVPLLALPSSLMPAFRPSS